MNEVEKKFIAFLEDCLQDKVSYDEFHKHCFIDPDDTLYEDDINEITHLFSHFFTDEDIREIDPVYDKSVRENLREELELLKEVFKHPPVVRRTSMTEIVFSVVVLSVIGLFIYFVFKVTLMLASMFGITSVS